MHGVSFLAAHSLDFLYAWVVMQQHRAAALDSPAVRPVGTFADQSPEVRKIPMSTVRTV